MVRPLRFEIAAVRARIGEVISMDAWAEWARIPHRSAPDAVLRGSEVHSILGIASKSWSPSVFRDPQVVIDLMRDTIAGAGLEPGDIDAAVIVTCTPFEVMLDQDAFRLLRGAGVPDHVVPMVHMAGCAGLARAMATVSRLDAKRVLIVAYTAVSPLMCSPDGEPNPIYLGNGGHPRSSILWASPATFSDGAAAMVLTRCEASAGACFYTRDALDPAVTSGLVEFPGGGALHPPGFAGSTEQSAFGLVSQDVVRYYVEGMRLNHERLLALEPDYVDQVRRIYTHQASPGLVERFRALAVLPPEKVPTHAARLGNLVTPSTMKLLADDLEAGVVGPGDRICVSVVGAGPERGAFIGRIAETVG